MPERKQRILVVDDRREMAEMLADGLSDRGYEGIAAVSSRAALAQLDEEQIDLLVTDLRMPEPDGLALLDSSRKAAPERPVIVMTAFGAIDSAVESIRRGAYHYLSKPFKPEELLVFVERALDESRVRRALRSLVRAQPNQIVGKSKALQDSLETLRRTAETDVPILLLGETGTGKGVFARALHAASRRAGGPFVAVNCAALPEPLLETELFGHVRGAFTGAIADRSGLFAEADGGTLLLDEIGEMPLALQAKLLHAIEAGTVRPVGASRERRIDVRVLAATHRDLRERARAGQFRDDLLYRLDVVSLRIPPLRERREDLDELIEHFLRGAKARYPASPVGRFSAAAQARLAGYPWPGNVRELQHAVERVVLLGRTAEAGVADLPETIRGAPGGLEGLLTGEVLPISEVQRRYASWALARFGGQRGRTAEALDIDGKTLAKWLSE